jgi:NADH-quinone oxidoreductase subunit G
MLKQNGTWQEVEWQVALDFVAKELKRIQGAHGAASIGLLATPHQTIEELHLLGKLAREFAGGNVDFRLRQSDFSGDGQLSGAPWLGMKVADLSKLDRVLVIGSTIRKDHPLIAHRLRQAAKKVTQLNFINPFDDELLMRVANKAVVPPSAMTDMLAQVVKSAAEQKNAAVPAEVAGVTVTEPAQRIAASLVSGQNGAVFLGNLAQHHPQAAQLHALAQALAAITGAKLGILGEAANSVGGYVVGAIPGAGGKNAGEMLKAPLKAYVLLGVEAELDTHDPQQAVAAMKGAELVVAMSPYQHKAAEYANVLLPVSPFTETAGAYINTEGTVQDFQGVVQPLGETRPAWKVLRVLGNLLGLKGFEQDSAEQVRREALGDGNVPGKLGNALKRPIGAVTRGAGGLQRIAEVPAYAADAIVRRARSLQATHDATAPIAWVNRALYERLGLRDGDALRVRQGAGEGVFAASVDDKLPADCVRLVTGRPETATLASMFGAITVERAPAQQKVAV